MQRDLTKRIAFLFAGALLLAAVACDDSARPETTAPGLIMQELERAEIEIESELIVRLTHDEPELGYMIYFRSRPDLSTAYELDWHSRGRYVAAALQKNAERAQQRVRALLDTNHVEYKAFWIDNIIAVERGDLATLNQLMAYDEIAAIRAPRTMALIKPEHTEPAVAFPQAIESNLTRINADEVWALGYRGEGMVLASIDSGVRYTHEVLVEGYRGNLGGGSFDHNFNWWDPYVAHPGAPVDYHSHGSHVTGIMTGEDAAMGNRIGVAPGAVWIACAGCNSNQCSGVSLLECAQFLTAPWDLGQDNPDPDKRPHVINNSWGDCGTSYDGWYQGVVDAWHAAGIYPVFANGNNTNCLYPAPPGCNTVGNPARYGNVSGVGSTGQNNGAYATHSNWGPTDNPNPFDFDGHPNIKPDFAAPGVNIRSAVNTGDGSYESWGGDLHVRAPCGRRDLSHLAGGALSDR